MSSILHFRIRKLVFLLMGNEKAPLSINQRIRKFLYCLIKNKRASLCFNQEQESSCFH